MQTTLKVLSLIGKGLAVITGLAAYSNIIPAKWSGVAVIVFGVASVLKDTVNRVADILDDGQANNSFKA
jgi:hypothetical protein